MSFLNRFKKLHKWFALLVGIQLFLWIVSGIVFSFIDHDKANGHFIYKNNQSLQIKHEADFSKIIKAYPAAIEITQLNLLDKAVFKVLIKKQTILLNAQTMEVLTIDKALVKSIAALSYQGSGKLLEVNFVTQVNDENRGFSLPIWQLIYDDEYQSHIYLSATTGQYKGIITDSWRTFDFFMMLHFMDYFQRGDFNHGLIIVAALMMLFFSLTGVVLVYTSFTKEDFLNVINKLYTHNKVTLILLDKNGTRKTIKVDKDLRLLEALAEESIELESACGGGGLCGCCRVKHVNTTETNLDNLTDHDILDSSELKQGYRLACQLSVDSKMAVELPIGFK